MQNYSGVEVIPGWNLQVSRDSWTFKTRIPLETGGTGRRRGRAEGKKGERHPSGRGLQTCCSPVGITGPPRLCVALAGGPGVPQRVRVRGIAAEQEVGGLGIADGPAFVHCGGKSTCERRAGQAPPTPLGEEGFPGTHTAPRPPSYPRTAASPD